MFVNISRTKIKKEEENRITSHLIYEPHKRQKLEKLKLHPKGIFSKEIFGNFHKCECGELIGEEGFCKKCNTRVIDPKHMPDFYIDLTIEVPVFLADYDALIDRNANYTMDDVKGLINYEKFLAIEYEKTEENEERLENNENKEKEEKEKVKGNVEVKERKLTSNFEIVNFDINNEEESNKYITKEYQENHEIIIGVDALRYLGISEEWINENTVDYLLIPHPAYRPLISDNMAVPFISGINQLYSSIIKKINDAIDLHDLAKGRPLYLLSEYKSIVKLYNEIINSLFDELQNNKYNIIKSEVISHPISGAIRAVVTNRHDIDEDVILIGDTLVETLWPYLYEKYDGNMALINEELVNGDYLVLINRPPTIAHLSIMAMKPRIASIYPFGKTNDTNRCLLHNYDYAIRNEDKIGVFEDETGELGDIERFGQGLEDGIDNVGLRVVSTNPIIMDGLAGDYDGDVIFCIALYSNNSLRQAQDLLPSKSYLNFSNGSIRNHIIEDFIFTLKEKEKE